MNQRLRATYHEAGHAVAILEFGHTLLRIEVGTGTSGDGLCKWVANNRPSTIKPASAFFAKWERVSEAEIIALAGLAAENKIAKEYNQVGQELAAMHDFMAAEQAHKVYYKRIGRRPMLGEAARHFAMPHAIRLVERNWLAIRRIAAALRTRRDISGEEARKLWQATKGRPLG